MGLHQFIIDPQNGSLPPVSVFLPNQPKAIILFLYGGGPKFSVDLFARMRALLYLGWYGTAVFTYRFMYPHMECGGLHTRVEDAEWALAKVREKHPGVPVILCGISMGGYIATHLIRHKPDGVILIAPAAYDRSIVPDRICFGPKFTERIRGTYMLSDGFDAIARFQGPLLVVRFSEDEVVKEIPQVYYDQAGSAKKKLLVFPGDHYLFRGNGNFPNRANQTRQNYIVSFMMRWFDEILSAHM